MFFLKVIKIFLDIAFGLINKISRLLYCIAASAVSRAILEPVYWFGIPNPDPQILEDVRLVLYLFNVKDCLSLFIVTDSHKNDVLSTTEC